MFGRVAVNYVKLVFGLTEERWRDVFFKVRAAVLDESTTWFLPQTRQMYTTSVLHGVIHSAMHTLPAYTHTHTQSYPDVIAQCVYSTFIYAFPTSWNNFDEDFKNELCNTISLWQVGEQYVQYGSIHDTK